MPTHSADLSLLLFAFLSTAVFASAWFFASRRKTASRSQALLDAALLGYLAQYLSVGLPGLLHCLRFFSIAITAVAAVAIFVAAGWKKRSTQAITLPLMERTAVIAIALFALAFVLLFAHSQANLPVISNDAMTYHFPAAVQWLQQQKIGLFQTWFFNPANTYSPLAGSMFIGWMIAPFHSDVLARFVEVPALIGVGIAMYCLCKNLGAKPTLAALIAAAAMFARPIFLPCMMGKDDLFVAFFFLAALIALSPQKRADRFGPLRFGIALGLLLATKYTALLSVPILLLAIDGPRWRWRGWITVSLIAMTIAGPWYLRNWIVTGNPIFPMFSLFTMAHSQAFHPWQNAVAVLIDGAYGLPLCIALVMAIPWLGCSVFIRHTFRSNPLQRACALGVPLGCLIFFAQSPFPEIRFVLPVFLLLFACAASWPGRYCTNIKLQLLAGIPLLLLSVVTVFGISEISVSMALAGIALLSASIGMTAIRFTKNRPLRLAAISLLPPVILLVYAYINWTAYSRDCRESLFDEGGGYAVEYPNANRLWRFVNENIPPDATVAYTNMYLIYPLQGPSLQRRLVYAPTRFGIRTIADLGWFGRNLSGEKLVPIADRATIAAPDRSTWLMNLKITGAKYLIIGHGGVVGVPPEEAFVAGDPVEFHGIFAGDAGAIYAVTFPR